MRSLKISHTGRWAPLQPVPKTQVPCTPYRPPNRTGVKGAPAAYGHGLSPSCTWHIGRRFQSESTLQEIEIQEISRISISR